MDSAKRGRSDSSGRYFAGRTRKVAKRRLRKTRAVIYKRPGPFDARIGDTRPIYVRKVFQLPDWTVATLAATGAGTYGQVQASSIPHWSSYATLYDFYKLFSVKVTIHPMANINTTGQMSNTNPAFYNSSIHSCVEYYNMTAPAFASDIMNDSSYRRTGAFSRDHIIGPFMPKMLTDTDSSLINTDSAVSNQWMSTQDAGDAYFNGWRLFLDPVSSAALAVGNEMHWQIFVEVVVGFKDPT